MKITQEVRAYAESQGLNAEKALDQGMQERSELFRSQGANIYEEV